MQRTQEIPPHSWEAYLNNLSQERRSRPVTVQIESEALGAQVLAQGYPLLGLTLDTAGSEPGTIAIMLDAPGRGSVSHHVGAPARIYEAQLDLPGGARLTCLDIESRTGEKTLVTFT